MKLEVAGIEYENFTSASAEIRLDALSNTFSFEAATTKKTPLPFTGGETCRIIVDDIPVITGYLEILSGSYDDSGHNLYIQGRDKTGDLLDSGISELGDIKEKVSLKSIIEKVVDNIGADIQVIDNANPKLFNSAEDISAPEPGENAFQFLEKLARKRQVLLTSNGDGNIVISTSPGGDSGGFLQNLIGVNGNNVLTASFTYDQTGRFNIYQFKAGLNPVALNSAGTVGIDTLVNQSGLIRDTKIRAGRQMILISEGAYSDDENEKRALWEARIRKARGRVYSASVRGYRPLPDAKWLWDVNQLVTVVDDFAQINAQMLINSVAFSYNVDSGKTTTLAMVEKNAYSLTLDEPKTEELGF